MAPFKTLESFTSGHLAAAAVIAAAVLAAAWMLWRAARRIAASAKNALRGHQAEDTLTVAAAGVATAVAMNGMWRFAGRVLHFSGGERISLFCFLELAVVVSAFRARRNIKEFGSAGVEGVAVWALSAMSAVFSALDAGTGAEAVFRLAAPLVAAWLWHRGLGLERRRMSGRAIHWRLTAGRVLVWLGLAEPSARAAGDVDAYRRIARLARAAKRLRDLRASGARAWRQRLARRRLDAAMEAAVEHAGLASDPARQDQMRGQLAALNAAESLASLNTMAPWDRREAEAAEINAIRQEAAAMVQAAAQEAHRMRDSAAKRAGEATARVHALEESLAAERARAEAAEQELKAARKRSAELAGALARTEKTRTGEGRTEPVDREAIVTELAGQIRDAIEAGERWQPDYPALMKRTGFRRSWCEKAVRDARTAAAFPGSRTDEPHADPGDPNGAYTDQIGTGDLALANGRAPGAGALN